MIILGIDPGYDRLGLAVIKKDNPKEKILFSTCVQTAKKDAFIKRLNQVVESTNKIIDKWQPQVMVLETILFSKNQKTALQIAEVRGALLYLASLKNLPVAEYNPLQVKQTICGFGGSDKKQITEMVKKLIEIKTIKTTDDEYDAIAIALTHSAHSHFKS